MIKRILHRPFFIRLFNWEYWPFYAVYGPILIYWFYLCLRSRSFFFFNTSNPTIGNGGFMMESKWEIYKLLPSQHYPPTIFFDRRESEKQVLDQLRQSEFQYPLVGKPDIGMKGMAVKKLDNECDLLDYIRSSKVNYLVQEFVPYPNEVGIFYYRFPNEAKGHISGIVYKEFLTVKGNGYASARELLLQDKRYILQLQELERSYGKKLDRILPKGEELILVPYGNHVRGARFTDATYLADEKLRARIDEVCQQVEGFYFGRLDIRYNTWEELREGRNFSIIELNGAGSEPTHIYDPRHSIFFAWKEIIRHWKILWKISAMNHRNGKQPYMATREGLSMLRENSAYVKMIRNQQRA
jgi:hypothetical protein